MASYDAASVCHVGLQLQREELLQLCVLHFKAVNNEQRATHATHTLTHTHQKLITPSLLQRERETNAVVTEFRRLMSALMIGVR